GRDSDHAGRVDGRDLRRVALVPFRAHGGRDQGWARDPDRPGLTPLSAVKGTPQPADNGGVATPLAARGPIVATLRRALRVGLTSGLIAGLLVVGVAPPASASDPLTCRKMIGRPRLGSPEGVVTGASGAVYVIDPYSN